MLDSLLDKVNVPMLLLRGNTYQTIYVESVKFWQEIIKNIQVKFSHILVICQ